ncbi:RNA-binding protein 25 [Papilio xuthus]|uniref:RNA-binding protein 25 n=1 Tax=Papilio xuthus TaxID=66420 RepID=A0A194QF23_PAPXU|nr:RNA-binding protein 25 [Papilio xuthus]
MQGAHKYRSSHSVISNEAVKVCKNIVTFDKIELYLQPIESQPKLQEALLNWNHQLQTGGLVLSVAKTQYMSFNNPNLSDNRPIPIDDKEKPGGGRRTSTGGKDPDKGKKGEGGEGEKEKENKCAEEKRKHIKSLIDKIPTQKEQLFQYKLDTSQVPAASLRANVQHAIVTTLTCATVQIDNVLMEKKIRPWINKKIIEYIGEPEPTLVDFICSKVLAGSAPAGILDDVQMVSRAHAPRAHAPRAHTPRAHTPGAHAPTLTVRMSQVLDDEAEVFVVKMWRLLIYELEAKRAGLHK